MFNRVIYPNENMKLNTQEHLDSLLKRANDVISELEVWSVYNQDKYMDCVWGLKHETEILEKRVDAENPKPLTRSTCLTCFGLDDDIPDCETCNGTGYELDDDDGKDLYNEQMKDYLNNEE